MGVVAHSQIRLEIMVMLFKPKHSHMNKMCRESKFLKAALRGKLWKWAVALMPYGQPRGPAPSHVINVCVINLFIYLFI